MIRRYVLSYGLCRMFFRSFCREPRVRPRSTAIAADRTKISAFVSGLVVAFSLSIAAAQSAAPNNGPQAATTGGRRGSTYLATGQDARKSITLWTGGRRGELP